MQLFIFTLCFQLQSGQQLFFCGLCRHLGASYWPFGWVRHIINLLEFHYRHMGVNLCRLQVRVSQHLLDKTDVCAIIQHQSRHRVAEHNKRQVVEESRVYYRYAYHGQGIGRLFDIDN